VVTIRDCLPSPMATVSNKLGKILAILSVVGFLLLLLLMKI
jgi:hypothetical protein